MSRTTSLEGHEGRRANPAREPSRGVRQEPPDIAAKPALVAGAIVLVVGAASLGVMQWILHSQEAHRHAPSAPASKAGDGSASAPGGPLEYTSLRAKAKGQQLQDEARRELGRWGWIEPGKVARVPIDEASRWLVERARAGKLSWPEQPLETSSMAAKQPPTAGEPRPTPTTPTLEATTP